MITPSGAGDEAHRRLTFHRQLADADARAIQAERDRVAAADHRARLVAAEVRRRGYGAQSQIAGELGITVAAISKAVRRAAAGTRGTTTT